MTKESLKFIILYFDAGLHLKQYLFGAVVQLVQDATLSLWRSRVRIPSVPLKNCSGLRYGLFLSPFFFTILLEAGPRARVCEYHEFMKQLSGRRRLQLILQFWVVAQPGSALGLGPRCRRFESCLPNNNFQIFYIDRRWCYLKG